MTEAKAKKKIKVNGVKADLIDEGVKIKRRMKLDEDRLKEIKSELKYSSAGIYLTPKGGVLDITSKPLPVVIPAKAALDELKANRLGKRFGECVNVVIKKLEAVLGKEATDKLKEKYPSKTTLSWSFK